MPFTCQYGVRLSPPQFYPRPKALYLSVWSEAEPTTAVDATEALRLSKCRSWADSGECKKNPTYMKSKCSDVCAARDEAREKQRQQRAARQRGPQRLVREREET